MTRYSFYRRVKMSHPSLLFFVNRIALLFWYQALSRMQTLGIQFAPQTLLSSECLAAPRPPCKHLTLTGFGWETALWHPLLGEPREQSKEFEPFPKSKNESRS